MKRREVPVRQTWDLSLISSGEDEAWQDAETLKKLADRIEKDYKGKLRDAGPIVTGLQLYEQMCGLACRISAFFELDLSTDFSDSRKIANANKAGSMITEVFTKTSFVESEIALADSAVLEEAIKKGGSVSGYLKKLLRRKPHILGQETEKVLAALAEFMETPYQVYNQAKLSDMRFDPFTVNGKDYPLSYALFEDEYEYEKDQYKCRSDISQKPEQPVGGSTADQAAPLLRSRAALIDLCRVIGLRLARLPAPEFKSRAYTDH